MDGRHPLVTALAAAQNDVITMRDAVMSGYDEAEVELLCRNGLWTRLRRGLYSPFPPDPTTRMRLDFAAALRAVEIKNAVIAHLSAARLWQVKWLVEPQNSDVWIACDVPGRPRYYPNLRILPAALPSEDVTDLHGLPVSTPARTAVDLARHLSFEPAVVAIDSLRYAHQITDAELDAVAERCRGWPYVRRARRALGFSVMNAESPLESRYRIRFAELGLPGARWQVVVIDANGDERRVDAIFGRRAGLEVDGKVKYRTAEDLWKEKRREDAIRAVGIPLLRLTAAELDLDPRVLKRRLINHMISTGDWIEGVGPTWL